MIYTNTPQLKEWLKKDFPEFAAKDSFDVEEHEYLRHLTDTFSRPAPERRDAAAFRCLTHGKPARKPEVAAASISSDDKPLIASMILGELISIRRILKIGAIGIGILLLMLFGAIEGHAQNVNAAVVVAACGTPPTNIPAASAGSPARVYLTVDPNGQICINGTITGGNSASVAVAAAAPSANVSSTGINVANVQREATGTNTSGSTYALDVNCAAGCAGGTNDTDDGTIAGAQVTGLTLPLTYVYDGSNWKRLTVSAAGSGLGSGVLTVQGNPSGSPIPVSGTVAVTGVSGSEYVQDVALTVATTQGGMAMGRASAAAPTNVSADDDAVMPWYLRSGAQAVQLTNAGVLTLSGSGNTTGALRVELANNGSGRMATVDVVTAVTSITNALPAGTNGIGKLTANSGVVIGDVNVAALVCTTGATGLCKAEDAVAGSGDLGVPMLGVIQATLTAPAADGDYTVAKLDANGATWVTSTTVDAAENAAVATNPVPIGGVYRSSPVTLDAGDVGYPLLDVNGRLIVNCNTGCSGGTQYTQDAALTVATSVVTLAGGRASAAVPTDVSADNDAVMAWYLRSGAQAIQPTFGGVLGVAGNGASGTGVQRVTIANDSTGILALTTGSAQIGHLEANQSVNVAQINGVTTLMGNGASGTGAQRVTIANDSTGILAGVTTVTTLTSLSQLGGVALPIEDAAETAAGVGIYAMGVRRDTLASSAGTTGDNTMASYTADGAMWSANVAATNGGLSMYNVEPGASDNHANIKNGAGQVYSVHAFSKDTVANYIRLYNAASGFNGCNSATNLVWSGIIPGASTGAGFVWEVPTGIPFSTGISICVSGAYGQTSTTSATASVMEVNVGYK